MGFWGWETNFLFRIELLVSRLSIPDQTLMLLLLFGKSVSLLILFTYLISYFNNYGLTEIEKPGTKVPGFRDTPFMYCHPKTHHVPS